MSLSLNLVGWVSWTQGQNKSIPSWTSASTKLDGNGASRGSPAQTASRRVGKDGKKRSQAVLSVQISFTFGLPAISLKLPVFEYFYPPPPTSGGYLLLSFIEI